MLKPTFTPSAIVRNVAVLMMEGRSRTYIHEHLDLDQIRNKVSPRAK